MSPARPPRLAAASLGFSLIEFMIAMVLGLLLTAAAGSIFLGSSRSYRTQGSVAQVQEEGRFATQLVVPVVRLAGYLPSPVTQTDPGLVFKSSTNKLAVFGIDNADGSKPTAANFPGFDPSKIVSGTDVLAIAYRGKSTDTGTTDTRLATCLGQSVNDTSVAVNIFYIANDESGIPNLYCYDNVTAFAASTSAAASRDPQPLVAGVADLQIVYGISAGARAGAVRYVSAGDVGDWTRVVSVQLTFTVRSLEATETGSATDVVGGKLTHSFTSTIQIRNRLSS